MNSRKKLAGAAGVDRLRDAGRVVCCPSVAHLVAGMSLLALATWTLVLAVLAPTRHARLPVGRRETKWLGCNLAVAGGRAAYATCATSDSLYSKPSGNLTITRCSSSVAGIVSGADSVWR
jgi:hypothetical protein